MTATYRLITIPPSHYCEKARWALELAGVAYAEERHPPLLHLRAVRAAGGRHSTPVLRGHGVVLADSTDILEHLQRRHGERWSPYPLDSQRRLEAAELEEVFDTRLGPHTRRLAYFHLLQRRDLFLRSVLAGVGRGERMLFRALGPLPAFLMRRGMSITADGAARSLARVREVFAEVGERLAAGRPYLVAGAFTAADLSFAALAAPVILPQGYGAPLPSLDELPAEMLAVVEELRASPAGEFALRMYRDHR
ncbi:MAG: glutathione S-transferase [Thermoanaerobaculales bacterium]|jgi:glutathione S-transferase|nr:glutathione S-transferase [Thermoanaerobaculales bacterium]